MEKITEDRIKSAARIVDVMRHYGVDLGQVSCGNYYPLSPFREDRHKGSFVVSESKNLATDFATGESWGPIDAMLVLEYGSRDKATVKEHYEDVLRLLAAMYGIIVDDKPVPKVVQRPIIPKEEVKERPQMVWPFEVTALYLRNFKENPLIQYLASLPLAIEDRERLVKALQEYRVGTSMTEKQKGWTVFWQIAPDGKVWDAKLMKYHPDGHRVKEGYANDWLSSMARKAGTLDTEKYQTKKCYFGMHLIDRYPNAEVCIVESEKTAIICSAFVDMDKRIFLASGGLSYLTPMRMQPLILRNRYITLIPDKDGHDKWKKQAELIAYPRLTVSEIVQKHWIKQDGPKADIGDILIRMSHGIEETTVERAARLLGVENVDEGFAELIEMLDLRIDDEPR